MESTELKQDRTIFEKIIDRDIPSDIVFEDDDLIVIKDISPKAPIHLLIIPKKPIKDIASLKADDQAIAGKLLLIAGHLSETIPGAKDFRLIANNGASVGQSVFHLHFHFLAGKAMDGF
ncbi:HIT domain-containing protein [bacterium]|jgi:histidine triad (HIT) family protein|nr:HIT domain-containing protein [bacterium]MBT3903387.1 HIT domain-containing protein [bacterium]MBT5345854.1 HIT domain-containing protein [bacterium]MBT6130833.1 HIT domain-containing protein [bacterium]MBT6528843.1 HIT domain-containing protein [bacterium]